MSKMSQKEAVFVAVQAFLTENNRAHELEDGEAISFTREERSTVVGMIVSAIHLMELSTEATVKFDTAQKVKTYVSGLTNNWLRKDTRLNGGSKYIAKNPGSRAGSGDDQLKALKALRSTLSDASQISQIDSAITARIATIKPVKSVVIDMSFLPEEFKHLVK